MACATHTSVVIPSYQRPESLERCLASLHQQEHLPDEAIVVARESDEATRRVLREVAFDRLTVREVTVTEPGNVAAYNAGLAAAEGDIIAFTDDDTTPHTDWLSRIVRHFEERPDVGGIGGRDWLYLNGELQDASMHPGAGTGVGHLQWHGRIIGNHHLGEGESREVDVLKGANMSFRREALDGLHFDKRMRGLGSHPGHDFKLSLSVKQRGWKLIYDPAVAVDHHLGERPGEDVRPGMGFSFAHDVMHAHNETLLVLEHIPWHRRAVFLLWGFLVGTRDNFGLAQLLRFLPRQRTIALKKWLAGTIGRWQGVRTFWASRQ